MSNSNKSLYRIINTFLSLGTLSMTQVLKGTIVFIFQNQLPIFFIFQFVGSTLQGRLSDIYKRSKALNFSLVLIIITTSLLVFTQLYDEWFTSSLMYSCMALLALGGNVDVIGRSEIIDTHYHTDRRKVMSWTVLSEALG